MRYELKRIEIWSAVKIIFIISLFLGFFISLFYAGLFSIMSAFGSALAPAEFSQIFPVGGAFVIAIFVFGTMGFAVMSTIAATIFIGLYNIIARWAGGFRVRFDAVEEKSIQQINKVLEELES
jgi:zona occludens toxin (predicted ATPase)